MRKIIIAIDGLSACGKSITACKAANILGYLHFNSGAMYRAVTVYFLNHNVHINSTKQVTSALNDIELHFNINYQQGSTELYMNGANVEQEIRKNNISKKVSKVSELPTVRRILLQHQQKLGKHKGIVMDGRDIGSSVFPNAELKLFMTADLNARSLRRYNEIRDMGNSVSLDKVKADLEKRDQHDSMRKLSPLQKVPDASILDTTHMTINEQVDEVVSRAIAKITHPTG